MGPQLISCGTIGRVWCVRVEPEGFNGAAADQLRNASAPGLHERSVGQASMGPQLISCGTFLNNGAFFAAGNKLQWGRS